MSISDSNSELSYESDDEDSSIMFSFDLEVEDMGEHESRNSVDEEYDELAYETFKPSGIKTAGMHTTRRPNMTLFF